MFDHLNQRLYSSGEPTGGSTFGRCTLCGRPNTHVVCETCEAKLGAGVQPVHVYIAPPDAELPAPPDDTGIENPDERS